MLLNRLADGLEDHAVEHFVQKALPAHHALNDTSWRLALTKAWDDELVGDALVSPIEIWT